ncbi:MAG: hypothetical protein EA390_12250 [Balneolaceae bacterium]|nr:MAG: hypothetical protein EA390_12250 [Balneolaceae bacterium]
MKKLTTIIMSVAFILGLSFHTAEAQKPDYDRKGIEIGSTDNITFSMGLHSVGRVQILTQDNVRVWSGGQWVTPDDQLFGMQTSFANLEFMMNIGDGDIEVFFDGLLATQRHPSQWWGNNGYMYIRHIPGNSFLTAINPLLEHIDIKAGNFFANFGEHQFTRTMNADAHRNPLVGNPVMSPIGSEPGMEIYHKGAGYGLMVGAGIGAPEQDFQEARGYSFRTKLWLDMIDGVYLSGSFYTVDHDAGVNRGTNLFRRERHGSSYGGVWNLNNDNSGAGEGPGQARPGNGSELTAWEINGIFSLLEGNKISAFYGQGEDIGPNPNDFGQSGDEKWSYYMVEVQQFLNDNFYLSGRYSNINYSEFLTTDNTGDVYRLQAGFGTFVTDNILLKAEYVYQKATGFNEGTTGVVTSVDVGMEPTFQGLMLEVGVSF